MVNGNLYIYPVTGEADIKEQLGTLLGQLPPWRREKALSYKFALDQFLCAKAYLLLRDGLADDFGIADEVRFAYGTHGKPFLRDHPGIHFNLSHCRKGVACAISHSPVGIDVEEITYDEEIARHIFREEEYRRVAASPDPAESFTKLWTEKESYVKMLGCGLLDNMRDLSIPAGTHFSSVIEKKAGYVVTVCSDKE